MHIDPNDSPGNAIVYREELLFLPEDQLKFNDAMTNAVHSWATIDDSPARPTRSTSALPSSLTCSARVNDQLILFPALPPTATCGGCT